VTLGEQFRVASADSWLANADGDDVTASAREAQADESSPAPQTHGERVKAGVARAAFLERLLREPLVVSTLDGLAPAAARTVGDVVANPPAEPIAWATEDLSRRALISGLAIPDAITALIAKYRLEWQGPWLPEFLVAAADFHHALESEDLRRCTLADPTLANARGSVRFSRHELARHPWMAKSPFDGLLAAILPEEEPLAWASRAPDWIELFALLVDHAVDRREWTRQETGYDRLWPFTLYGHFVWELEPGDDPAVLHALVDAWAAISNFTIDKHTAAPLPRGRIPDHSGFYPDGRVREGGRDKLRRWVSWYVEKELHKVAPKDLLPIAFPHSDDPHERSSELNRRIREVKRLLALELSLDAGQPVRLWRLLQEYRCLLESRPPGG
jgi:hypothetical protein